MGCLLALISLLFPRLAILVLWLFTHYLHSAYQTWIWPVLGFFWMPFTTLAYAAAINENGGSVNGWWLALVVIAVLTDLGFWRGSGKSVQRHFRGNASFQRRRMPGN